MARMIQQPAGANLALARDALAEMARLEAEGKFESAEAEAIRDEMDGVWERLSAADREQVRACALRLAAGKAGEVVP